ncbi:MAG: tRNA (adenosine(37)-N6)-dimethylallyltransferase MiaA [Oscillospiraceae bacterium]|nr:tRNA (adenosine(37)-N6)-dimethylallyltransferase MiaA [Oscillospiraceae bacterium]
MDKLVCVVGPTASGKSDLAVELAMKNGEVISCDSMQVYRGMDVGTAKPTEAEMRGVRHHMLSVADPAEDYSVSRYVEQADPVLQEVLRRGKLAVIAGGTGLYMDALIAGRDFAPHPGGELRRELEAQFDARGAEAMLAELRAFDPDSAARLHPSDRKRIVRAIEIYRETGVTMTEHDRATRLVPPKYEPVWIGLWYSDRAELYAKIDRRVDLMLENGLVDEVKRLLASVPESATAMQAIGYKEIAQYLRGECTLDEAVDAIKQGSRRYAKRQLTWLRRNEKIFWIDRSKTDFSSAVSAARQRLAEFDIET